MHPKASEAAGTAGLGIHYTSDCLVQTLYTTGVYSTVE